MALQGLCSWRDRMSTMFRKGAHEPLARPSEWLLTRVAEMNLQSPVAFLDGTRIAEVRAKLDHRSLEFELGARRGVRFYTFSSLMLSPESRRAGEESYEFTGPRLGVYHETADPREGPFVSHQVERLEIRVIYPAPDLALVDVRAWADRSKSFVDSYWYKGPATGRWTFEGRMAYTFPRA